MFCVKCGNEIPDDSSFCPFCGAPLSSANGAVNNGPVPGNDAAYIEKIGKVSLLLSICSLVLGILGSILFGTTCAILGIACAVVGLVFSIKVRKFTGEAKGTAAFVMSIVGMVFGFLFFCCCTFCGACTCGFGCHGCVGSACRNASKINSASDAILDSLETLEDLENFGDFDF